MRPVQGGHPGESRLRFVFGSSVVSFKQRGQVTFGEIARRLGELLDRRHSIPIAIDLTLPGRHMASLSGRGRSPARVGP